MTEQNNKNVAGTGGFTMGAYSVYISENVDTSNYCKWPVNEWYTPGEHSQTNSLTPSIQVAPLKHGSSAQSSTLTAHVGPE